MNDPKRLCILVEPTKADLENWPFLQNQGGVMQMGRHKFFLHYCNTYNSYAIFRQKVAVMDNLGIDKDDVEYVHALNGKLMCFKFLQLLKSGMGICKMEDLLPSGLYYTDPEFNPDALN